MVGFMMRYHPALRALAEEPVAAYRFHMEIGHDVRQWRANWRFGDSYAAREEGGGVLLDLCHELDMAHVLFPGAGVTAVESIGHADFPGVDFATQVTLAQEDGPVGTVAMDYLSPKSLRRAQLRGREEVLDLDWLAPRWVRGCIWCVPVHRPTWRRACPCLRGGLKGCACMPTCRRLPSTCGTRTRPWRQSPCRRPDAQCTDDTALRATGAGSVGPHCGA